MVSYHTGPVLFEALEAALADPSVSEVILVNHENPEEDEARLAKMAAEFDRLVVHHTGENQGFARGCNAGVRLARSDYLLFLNPDAILQPGAAARLIEAAQLAEEPVIVGGRPIGRDGKEQRGGRRGELTFVSALTGFLGASKLFGLRDIHYENEALPEEAVPVPAVSGAAMLMSHRGFDQVAGFDEGYFLHVEDLDICKRVRELGGEVLFEPRATILHHGSTSKVSLVRVEMAKARGLIRYFRRHGGSLGWLKALILAGPIYVALLGRSALLSVRRR